MTRGDRDLVGDFSIQINAVPVVGAWSIGEFELVIQLTQEVAGALFRRCGTHLRKLYQTSASAAIAIEYKGTA